jgi:uncharacterized protein YjiS (DUF1127 family)
MNQTFESRFSYGDAGATGLLSSLGRLLLRAPETSRLWYERSRQRRQLARLDDRLLSDIGIDRATAGQEISKPFWRP